MFARLAAKALFVAAAAALIFFGIGLLGVALASALAASLGVTGAYAVAGAVLLLSLGYFTAGLHLDRFFLWVGVLLAAGAIVVTFVDAYAWTGVGIAVAGSLTVAGIRQERSRETIA